MFWICRCLAENGDARCRPAFTISAVLTLGVCIGANVAIFSMVDTLLPRPLPFPDSGRLVWIGPCR
jgi:hypothetical protein